MTTAQDYDPSLEYPGFDSESDIIDEIEATPSVEHSPFRLVIIQSPVIPPRRNIVEISPYKEVSIGRDVPSEPGAARLRLKEMAVSKYHAIIFWDPERDDWGLVDVGSVHGTFIKGYGGSTDERLSSAKTASHPRYLRHLDSIQIGGTTMVCHLHKADELGCEECNLSTGNELSLIHEANSAKPSSSSASDAPTHALEEPKDAKQSLAKLKQQLLRHNYKRDKNLDASSGTYIDRAASRRMYFGISAPSLPIPIAKTSQSRSSRVRATYSRASSTPLGSTETPSQTDVAPLPTSNIGHRLLSMQGWKPGTGLGVDMSGVAEPLTIKPMAKRAGIGSEEAR